MTLTEWRRFQRLTRIGACGDGTIISEGVCAVPDGDSSVPRGVRETLRFVFAQHVAEVYDDPSDMDATAVQELVEAGRFLGIDIWDRTQLDAISYRRTSDYEYERLQKIAHAVR